MRGLQAFAFLVGLAACGDNLSATTALFAVEAPGDDYYALPFPNDLHRNSDGTLDLADFPANSIILDQYRVAAQALDGFGLNGAMSSRFTAPLDPTSLPDPAGSLEAAASVYLVNVDPSSPSLGHRTPIIASYRDEPTNTIGAFRLVVRPYPGFTLDEGTTYALVLTDRIRDLDGAPVRRANDFTTLLGDGGSARMTAARAAYQPLVTWLNANGGTGDVVSAAVFTTQHATQVGPALRRGVYGTEPPVATTIVITPTASYVLVTGAYTQPNFQTGEPPYTSAGGEIRIGADGAAIVQRMEPMRFAMTVPLGAKPAGGWPLAIYAHGTGGDYRSFVDDGTGPRLAAQGIATISTDQVLHGPRDPAQLDPGVAFFNFANPYAARDNTLQGAADAWEQLRLATGLAIDDGAGGAITIDPTKVYFFGHSQGGVTGPAFVAFEPTVSGAVLSGTGGLLYLTLLHKTAPLNFASLIETFARDSPMDEDNPSRPLAQKWIDPADGVNYARYMVREPQPGPDGARMAPRNIFQTEGFVDTYAPNPAIEAFATALGGDLVSLPAEKAVEGLTLRGRAVLATPITENDNGVTAVLAQYTKRTGSDGHFVVFEVPAAEKQAAEFLGTLAATGHATVVSP
jgi:predicted esterase